MRYIYTRVVFHLLDKSVRGRGSLSVFGNRGLEWGWYVCVYVCVYMYVYSC